MRTIVGYDASGGGPGLVTIDGAPLGLPALRPDERRHSPDGFQWGYAGSGPAELARAILLALYPEAEDVREPACYQRFKADVIQWLPQTGFTLSETRVVAWLHNWRVLRGAA